MNMRKLMKRSNVAVLQRLPWSKEGSGQRAQSAADWSLEVPTSISHEPGTRGWLRSGLRVTLPEGWWLSVQAQAELPAGVETVAGISDGELVVQVWNRGETQLELPPGTHFVVSAHRQEGS